MPRKKSAIPPATRIRENQRRSRARRKELIQDLQHRLREYEAKELQATLAVQLAARRVAWENAQLRVLLASNGVSQEQIEMFLHDQEHIPARLPSDSIVSGKTQSSSAVQVHQDGSIEALHVTCPIDQVPHQPWSLEIGAREQEDSKSTREIEGQNFAQSLVTQVPTSTEEKSGCGALGQPCTMDAEQNNILPTVSDWFYPGLLTSGPFAGDNSMFEMSCEAAASIISSMRGNADREQARSQLGCEGREHCNVKNIKVLQVIGME